MEDVQELVTIFHNVWSHLFYVLLNPKPHLLNLQTKLILLLITFELLPSLDFAIKCPVKYF